MTGLLRSTINQGAVRVYGATSATLAIYGYVYFRFFPDDPVKKTEREKSVIVDGYLNVRNLKSYYSH